MKSLQDINLKQLIEQETGDKFNKEGYIRCPFHNEKTPSMSVKYFPDANKYRFKCWGCGSKGDALDFVMKIKNFDYKSARECLGLEVEKTELELQEDKIKSYIEWQIKRQDNKKGYKLIGLFSFTDSNNKVIYYKAKFRKPDGKKETPYYHIEGDKVVNTRGHDEVPYNLYNVLNGISESKVIVFTEGEKDSNTINNILKGNDFVATSIKGVKDLSLIKTKGMKIYVIGDTGEAGDQYVWDIRKEFYGLAKEFKIINLPGLKDLGDNKDITDWLESGHTKKELLNAFDRSLDIKSEHELQQDSNGIYRLRYDKKNENYYKQHITDFNLLEAEKIVYMDDAYEGIRLKFRSCIDGKVIEKTDSSKIFDNVVIFRNFLGINLTFDGKIEDLTKLKKWITRYFAIDNTERYNSIKFIEKDSNLMLVASDGTIAANSVDKSTISNKVDFNIAQKDPINKEELIELKKRIFRFLSPEKSISIIGTVINDLTVYQSIELEEKFHHLLLIGASESGKSTILEKVIAPILNYPLTEKYAMKTTAFSMTKHLSTGNYPCIFEEHKPSTWKYTKIQDVSDLLRNAYDRTVFSRGDKSLGVRNFQLLRPLIILGEENYANHEKALITRSCIIYIAKEERTEESSKSIKWLSANKDILNKFGRSLIDIVLNMSIDQYSNIRNSIQDNFNELEDRTLHTAVNIGTGIEIFNILLEKYGLKKIENYEKHIIKNIKEEILEGETEAKSTVEQMLSLYNEMIADGRALTPDYVIKDRGDGLFIRTSEMINQICEFVKRTESAEVVPIKLSDFRKQASKSKYLMKTSSRQFRIDSKPVWYDEYNKEKIRKLKLDSICKPELEEIPSSEGEQKVIEGMFNNK